MILLLMTLALAQEPAASEVFEPVVLPALLGGVPDRARPGPERPVANVLADGTIVIGGETVFDPEREDALQTLRGHLAALVSGTERHAVDGLELVKARLLVRADARSPFRSTKLLLEACTAREVLVHRLDFAVRDPRLGPRIDARGLPEPDLGPAQVLAYDTLLDVGPALEEGEEADQEERREQEGEAADAAVAERVEVLLRVRKEGEKWGPSGAPWTGEGPWTRTGRELEWAIGPRRTTDFADLDARLAEMAGEHGQSELLIDARPGVSAGEALAIFAAARAHGYRAIVFVGAYD